MGSLPFNPKKVDVYKNNLNIAGLTSPLEGSCRQRNLPFFLLGHFLALVQLEPPSSVISLKPMNLVFLSAGGEISHTGARQRA